MLASMAVGGFVNHHRDKHQYIVLEYIHPGLVREIIKFQCVAPDFRPVREGDSSGESKPCQSDQREPPRINEASVVIEPGQELVRINCRKQDFRQITVLTLG